LIGSRLVPALARAGYHVTLLSRDPVRAGTLARTISSAARTAETAAAPAIETVAWDPLTQRAPPDALEGREAVIHLAGENVGQRWSARAKRAIRDSRVLGTEHLIAGLDATQRRPRTLVCASATGYYGAGGEEPLDEDSPAGTDFLAQVCVAWEGQAERASELGLRVVRVRTGVVLDREGGALGRMLTPFRLGVGGPIASGRQYMPWIHHEDLVAIVLAAIGDERFTGAVNATAPEPVTNREFARSLGRVLRRPALLPLPALALRAIFGEMAEILITGARVMPAKALVLGYHFAHPELDEALRAALAAPRGG
jgi:uncharacterized protein (TIGR01777 family)